jgi:hypothetical protein
MVGIEVVHLGPQKTHSGPEKGETWADRFQMTGKPGVLKKGDN